MQRWKKITVKTKIQILKRFILKVYSKHRKACFDYWYFLTKKENKNNLRIKISLTLYRKSLWHIVSKFPLKIEGKNKIANIKWYSNSIKIIHSSLPQVHHFLHVPCSKLAETRTFQVHSNANSCLRHLFFISVFSSVVSKTDFL